MLLEKDNTKQEKYIDSLCDYEQSERMFVMPENSLNYEKYEMYKATLAHHDKAIKQGFYLECIMLNYGLIEDRLNFLLYRLGLIRFNPNGIECTKKSIAHLRIMLGIKTGCQVKVKDMKVKIEILQKLIDNTIESPGILNDISIRMAQKIDAHEFIAMLNDLHTWRDQRNHFVHGLMNKSPSIYDEDLKTMAENGKKYFRYLDKVVRRFDRVDIRVCF